MITFLVSGLWHGSNWTFVIWGTLHGMYLVVYNLWCRYIYSPNFSKGWSRVLNTVLCFALVAFAWIFFRANNVADAFTIISKIFTEQGPLFINEILMVNGMMGLLLLVAKDANDYFGHKIGFLHSKNVVVRYLSAIFLVVYIILFGSMDGGQFIYFQF